MRADPLFELDSDPKRPFRVLIVKLSSLGDVIHTLPVVHDLLGYRDDIVIDWVVEEAFADLVGRTEGVRKVIPVKLRRWVRHLFLGQSRTEWKAFVANLRSERYDAVFDLQGLSKSALVAAFARMTIPGQRIAMANRTEGSSYEVLTRLAADVAIRLETRVDAITRGRLVCAKSQNYPLPQQLVYGLQPHAANQNLAGQVVLITGSSRANKTWPQAHWAGLVAHLNAKGLGCVLVHGDDKELAQCNKLIAQCEAGAHVRILPRMPLAELMDHMASSAGVIGVDSGLSHLAVALDLPHVQIYNFDTAWRTGPQGRARQESVWARPTPTLEQVVQAWQRVNACAGA